MLELRSIAKRLGTMHLADVSLTVAGGEYFVLLGPSGVGKTVLVEMIAGLHSPDAGEVLWSGRDITATPPEQRGFAVVYQDYALFPHLTVARNIAYGLGRTGRGRRERRRRVAELAEMMQIGPLLGRRPGWLSGGEQQRVALARALATDPKMLLLDEPLAALDTNTRLRLRKHLKGLSRDLKIPVLHVTHDPEEAMTLGDRIGVLLDNRLCQTASAEELFRRPTDPAVAKFLGLKNVLTVTEVDGDVCRTGGVDVHASAARETTGHLWISPEEILLSRGPFTSSARNQFRGRVIEWDHRGDLLAVRVAVGELLLTSLITYTSFHALGVMADAELYVTFKSSAVHCF